jgi:hypothetical protein
LDYDKLGPSIIKTGILCILLFLLGNLSCVKQERTEPKSKINSPPVISSINIFPEKLTIESELTLLVQGHDPDGDLVTFQYQWIRNDEEIIGETKNGLKNGNFQKGDLIRVRVTPSDGKVIGAPFLSAEVKILNSLPVIQEVWIEPKVVYVTDHLKASVKSSDPDEDFVYYTYRWEKNGVTLGEEKKEALQRGQFKKGDSILVIVTPNDGESLGTPKKSETITISNRPPVIVSSRSNKMDGNIYTTQVQANDPDDDPIIFTLKSAPKGMEINKETGLIRWEIHKGDQGTQLIEIEASDSEGAKCIQTYTLSVDAR